MQTYASQVITNLFLQDQDTTDKEENTIDMLSKAMEKIQAQLDKLKTKDK